jgi:hypothetical protein
MPFFKEWKYYEDINDALPGMAFAISIWLPLILMYFTLDLTTSSFKNLERILLVITIIIVLISLWFNRERFFKWKKDLESLEL